MHVLAAILDPADNGFDISDLSVLLGVILTISVTTATIVRWNAKRVAKVRSQERHEMEARIKAVVEDLAAKVQPKNGGAGWLDVVENTNVIVERQTDIVRDVRAIRERLDDHIDTHNKST